MKKIFLGLLSLMLCVALCGCGSSSSASAISSLSSQLDETANTVSSVETVSPSSLGTSSDNLSATQNALMREEWNKAQILSKTAEIKNALSEDTSLSKEEISAVKELTNSLNKYTLSVAYSKNDLENTVKSISSLTKNEEKNADKLDAKLNRLACSSNARASYYENILNTLEQIDSYLSSSDESDDADETEEAVDSENEQNFDHSNTPYEQYKAYNSNNFNRAAYGGYGMGYGNMGYAPYGMNGYAGGTNTYNMPNGFNGFTGGYGQNIGGMPGTRFNLNRNTDTYAPMFRNVDTYRPSTSEKRIEEFENLDDEESPQSSNDTEKNFSRAEMKPSFGNEHLPHPMPHTPYEGRREREFFEPKNEQAENIDEDFFVPRHMNEEESSENDESELRTEKPDNEVIEETFAEDVENQEKSSIEKSHEQIKQIEPQANMEENLTPKPTQKLHTNSKIKAVTSKNEGREDWDAPVEAHRDFTQLKLHFINFSNIVQ